MVMVDMYLCVPQNLDTLLCKQNIYTQFFLELICRYANFYVFYAHSWIWPKIWHSWTYLVDGKATKTAICFNCPLHSITWLTNRRVKIRTVYWIKCRKCFIIMEEVWAVEKHKMQKLLKGFHVCRHKWICEQRGEILYQSEIFFDRWWKLVVDSDCCSPS